MRGTTRSVGDLVTVAYISTHVPHAGHDGSSVRIHQVYSHFNSRAPCGARHWMKVNNLQRNAFQLTCPMRGTTGGICAPDVLCGISTHVPHAGHDFPALSVYNFGEISTHVPHAGHDYGALATSEPRINFNSRAPCGARPSSYVPLTTILSFQLTCPMRGTTFRYLSERGHS